MAPLAALLGVRGDASPKTAEEIQHAFSPTVKGVAVFQQPVGANAACPLECAEDDVVTIGGRIAADIGLLLQ